MSGASGESRGAAPLVSVVMPTLNGGHYIRESVESVLSQRGPEIEVIVQDGGSSDDTLEVLESLGDERLAVVSEPDRGQSDALNRALRRARGDWILWLNASDLLVPTALEHVEPLLTGPYDFIYGNHIMIDAEGRELRGYDVMSELPLWRLHARGCPNSVAWVIRKEVFDRHGAFDPGLRFAMDYEFILRIAPHVRFHHCGEVLGLFRLHSDARSGNDALPMLREHFGIRRRSVGRNPLLLACSAYGWGLAVAYCALRPLLQTDMWFRLRPSIKI
jgi:glycosyltransferase involved in cell wall biosynthesis